MQKVLGGKKGSEKKIEINKQLKFSTEYMNV